MKTVELPGVKIDDVGSVWYDLLQKEFDVESVGANSDGTFIYVNDDEERDPRPIVETWVGKAPVQMSKAEVLTRRKEVMAMLEGAKKRRAKRAELRAAEEAERLERQSLGYPELKVSSTGQSGMFGIVEALSNGVDVHTILIQKVDPSGAVVTDGSEKLLVTVSHKVSISDAEPKLSEGMAMIQVGPSNHVGDFTLEVNDRSGNMKPVKLSLRFVKERSIDGQGNSPAPILEKKGGIMSTVRKIFGI